MTERKLSSIVQKEALEHAIYTVEHRAIPNMIDGFKPSQRFFVAAALDMCKNNKFQKVAAVGGAVSSMGYHHGETSASDAGQLIANTWNNNIAVLDGDGNFGSRLVQQAAAPRYTFCRPSKEFFAIYKDFDCCPVHHDLEHIPPRFYLPIIPMVLANGVVGIATGYATKILPHSKESLIECVRLAINGKLNKNPDISFPEFKGKVEFDGKKAVLYGCYELVSKTKLVITEIPYSYDRESYIKKLDELIKKDMVVSYNDRCGEDGFGFEVTLKRDFFKSELPHNKHEQILKDFKLTQTETQNITVIDENGKLKIFDSTKDLINHFVAVRMFYIDKRIKLMISKAQEHVKLASAKALFIKYVIEGEIEVKGVSKKELTHSLNRYPIFRGLEDKLTGMSIYQMTNEEVKKLNDECIKAEKEFKYWNDTTAVKEYQKDLKVID